MSGHGETCDPTMFSSQATIVQQPRSTAPPGGGGGDMGGGCVDCHDFYEIHV